MSRRSPDEIDRHVGARVRLQRQLVGMSQTELGKHLGVTFQQVQKYENGTNRIGAGRLHRIAQVLGRPVTYFYGAADAADGSPGTIGTSDPLAIFTAMAGAVELMKAFASIKDTAKRRNLVELARALSLQAEPAADGPAPRAAAAAARKPTGRPVGRPRKVAVPA